MSDDFNADALSEILEIDVDTYVEIIDCYIEDTPNILRALASGIESQNHTVMRDQAHKLKGSSATMGLTKVSKLAHYLEQLGREQSCNGATSYYETLTVAVSEAIEWLLDLKAKATA